MVITLPRQSEQMLFAGAFAQQMCDIDLERSIETFGQRWVDRVEQAFPGAVVTVGDTVKVLVSEAEDEHGAVLETVQDLGEWLFEDGEAWMVGMEDR